MAQATDKPIAHPEELRRFIKAVLAASDTATLVQMVTYRGGWADLCVRILAALAEDAPTCRELEDACRQNGIQPTHLRRRLEPVAKVLGSGQDGGESPGDHFEMLGVSPDATTQEIRRAFRRRARQLHPDHGGDTQAFIELTRAYHTLGNPERRRRYEAQDQPTVVAWSPPPPVAPPKRPRRSFLPLVAALSLLILTAFALDFAYRLNTPPHILHANRTRADVDTQQAGKKAETSPRERPSSAEANDRVPDQVPPSAGASGPAMPPDVDAADPSPGPVGLSQGPVLADTANFMPPEAPMATADPLPPPIIPQHHPPPAQNLDSPPLPAAPSAPDLGDHHLVLFYAPDVGLRSANELAAFLQQQGYRLSAPTRKDFAGESRVRFFHAADRPAAAKLRHATRRFLARQKDAALYPLRLSNLSQDHPGAPRGLLELWIGPPPPAEATTGTTAAATPQGRVYPSLSDRLRAFVHEYGRAYASRDVVQLAALFHTDAQENGRPIQTVLPIYLSNMNQVKDIDYRIELDGYQQGGDNDAFHIVGRFFARLELVDSEVRESRGAITMTLLPYGQSFLIKQLDYTLAQQ